MTVISAIVEAGYCVHATDSLLSREDEEGNRIASKESGRAKVILFSKLRGGASFWGSVTAKKDFGMLDLRTLLLNRAVALSSYSGLINLDEYMKELADEMNSRFRDTRIQTRGVGIHFSVFETVDGIGDVPELYLITNFRGDYSAAPNFAAQRQTYFTLSGETDCEFTKHHLPEYRKKVSEHLLSGNGFHYCNGQPELFGEALPSVNGMYTSSTFPIALVRAIVDVHYAKVEPNKRILGHPCIDVIIPSSGPPWSHVSMELVDGA
jgi:hypothetical protein